jgi:hypothetical protein
LLFELFATLGISARSAEQQHMFFFWLRHLGLGTKGEHQQS